MDAVAGNDPEGQVREVGEDGGVGGDHDVGQKRVLAVDGHRAVDGGDDRHLQVDQSLHDAAAFADGAVPVGGPGDVAEAGAVDVGHETVAGAGENQDAVVAVVADLVHGAREVGVHPPDERGRAAVGVEPYGQHTRVGTGHREVLEHREIRGGAGSHGELLSRRGRRDRPLALHNLNCLTRHTRWPDGWP
ncbi:hypothetical protein OG574_43640 [Streptomyces sp. NBC_01445]|nr:hypothetical protein [Streptomyces sp. NBC_01445]WSE09661.1 hypothetical protein OG574_43640 [Streptomyces sp. NBC_01445]